MVPTDMMFVCSDPGPQCPIERGNKQSQQHRLAIHQGNTVYVYGIRFNAERVRVAKPTQQCQIILRIGGLDVDQDIALTRLDGLLMERDLGSLVLGAQLNKPGRTT